MLFLYSCIQGLTVLVSSDDGPARKKAKKSFQDLLIALDYVEALVRLQEAAQYLRVARPDEQYCSPRKVSKTWNETAYKRCLEQAKGDLVKALTIPDARSARTAYIRLGTGCGKTHLLQEAPGLLGSTSSTYLTYNMNQRLLFDTQNGASAVLLRLLLRFACKATNFGCDDFLASPSSEQFRTCSTDLLEKLVVWFLKDSTGDIVIGVDELTKLKKDYKETHQDDNGTLITKECTNYLEAKAAIGALGRVAHDLFREHNKICVVLVTALTAEMVQTVSERNPLMLDPPKPTEEISKFLMTALLSLDQQEMYSTVIRAVSGVHFRSTVKAVDLVVQQLLDPSFQTVISHLKDGIFSKLAPAHQKQIREYVIAYARDGIPPTDTFVEQYTDSNSVVPPAIAWAAFDNTDIAGGIPMPYHPAQQIYKTSMFREPTKQLEVTALHYDRFRALYGLPVVPFKMEIMNVLPERNEWFHSLCFPREIATNSVDTNALLANCSKNKKEVVWTGYELTFGNYCYPDLKTHPCVDRACLARSSLEPGGMCLVLYQDKINADVPGAVNGLNKAADALKKTTYKNIPILCVVDTVGAKQPTSQDGLKYPYVLITSRNIEDYYTPQFAPAICLLRDLHTMDASLE